MSIPQMQFSVAEVLRIIDSNPGITTPELAEKLDTSVTIARWVVYETGLLEFYDGNHIRRKS